MGLKQRKSIHLKNYDYSLPGAYFFTICVQGRACILGDVVENGMRPSPLGSMVQECWDALPSHYPNVVLDSFVVMPNHVHGIISLDAVSARAGLRPAPTKPMSEIVRAFKSFSGRTINLHRGTPGMPVWQRNYYEHVIRGENDLNKIREYILNNPLQWALDEENPNIRKGVVAVGARHALPLSKPKIQSNRITNEDPTGP